MTEPSDEIVNVRPLLLRRFLWDIFPHDADLAEVISSLGLVPDGEEGQAMEHKASHDRLQRVGPMFKSIEILSRIMAEAMTAYLMWLLEKQGLDLSELPDTFTDMYRDKLNIQNTEVIYQGSIAMISHMFDYDVLTYTDDMKKKDH